MEFRTKINSSGADSCISELVVPVVMRDTLLLLSFANIKRANRCGLLFNVG